jgi:hypothetical protein
MVVDGSKRPMDTGIESTYGIKGFGMPPRGKPLMSTKRTFGVFVRQKATMKPATPFLQAGGDKQHYSRVTYQDFTSIANESTIHQLSRQKKKEKQYMREVLKICHSQGPKVEV